ANVPGYISEPSLVASDSPNYYHTGDSVTLTMIKGGVITGKVTTAANEPVVATTVRVLRGRDENGKPLQAIVAFRERLTDDRGVYRIYGLLPGTYIVSAGGPPRLSGVITSSAYDHDTPTYSPSSTRDTASEIYVANGEEVTADIQYRGETGHSISGTLGGLAQSKSQISTGGTVTLIDVRNRATIMNAPVYLSGNNTFAFFGVADGEYELFGSQFLPSRDSLTSEGRRVEVQGADVTGINLSVAPLGSIEGRLILENEPKAGCAKRRATASQETIIFGRRYEPETKTTAAPTSKAPQLPDVPIIFTNALTESVPEANGRFALKNLQRGSYRIDPRAPASGWYVRSIAIGSTQAAARNTSSSVARDGIILKSGERLSGLTVTITEGAASLRGRASVAEGQSLPPNLRVYLVPADKESADNMLRFFEARAQSDGSFAIGNIAPGRYWLISRAPDESDPTKIKSLRQDSALRSQVLKEAETARTEIPLQPCQRITDYDLRYSPAASEPKPKP
ncbi:MAG TPA: carboxypeptidase-like regulatory domain-containing protein, partial [Pyrinomonadaceae bacterium]|nr:carboxypeptidase-like regulatory domain-containing protein [Pyrinomonadaceae bacterium]